METPEKNPTSKKVEKIKTLKVSSLSEFKKNRESLVEGVVIQLPESKLNVLCSRPSLEDLIVNGKISKELVNIALKKEGGNLQTEDLQKYIELRDYIVALAVKKPKMVLKDAKDDELSLDCLSRSDKDFIFNYIEKGPQYLKIFRS